MNEGDVQGSNDDDEDIYKDIGDFRFDKELAKLEESNKAYIEEIARLTKRLNELTERNEALESINEILATNISILLKTAKAEIDRKQLVIDDFRKKLEGQSRRHGRTERSNFQWPESSKNCTNEPVKDNCNKSDVEEGEIVHDDSGGRSFNCDIGKTDESKNRDRRYQSGNHRKKGKSRERSIGRSTDTSSRRRKSRYPHESHSRHSSSSRSHHRSTSPDARAHSDKRTRSNDKNRHSSRSGHSHSSRSRKTDNSPHRKEESYRKSRERRRSGTRRDFEKSRKDGSTDRGKEEKSNRSESANDNKSKAVKPNPTRKKEKEVEVEESCNPVKTVTMAEYRLRSAEGSNQKRNDCDLLARQSVLADLYDEPVASKTFPEVPKDMLDKKSEAVSQNDDESGSGCESSSERDWSQRKKKVSEPVKGPKTLYSRRMEAKFLQQQQLMEDALSQKCSEDSCEKQNNEENQVATQEEIAQNETQVEKIIEEEVTEKEGGIEDPQTEKEDITRTECSSESAMEVESETVEKTTGVNLEQSFGESLVKKLLQLQATEENVGMNEFSPLKNNYKLSKISPLKPVSKQHILEYYNLKPSPQQLINIEPEVLDFSFSLPETPGKNFLSSFLPLSDAKECERREENDNSDDKGTAGSSKEENQSAADSKSGGESGIEDLITIAKSNKTKKRNCKTAKNAAGSETSSESKKSVETSDEEGGQSKPYKTRYQIRTRSKTENDKVKPKGRSNSGDEGGAKRERTHSLSDEGDSGNPSKRMKCETPKTENDTSIEVTTEGTIPDDITSFEVFRSVSDDTAGDMDALVEQDKSAEEKSVVEDHALWNGGDCNENKTEDDASEMAGDKGKPSLSSTGNSGDSSFFKVLRSYLMLSANDDTEDEAFASDNSSTGSGEYSDSGASALVDLL